MFCYQCLETLVSRQLDMQLFLADGCKEALLEEKRRFCFLVDKHCMFSYQTASFHDKVHAFTGLHSFPHPTQPFSAPAGAFAPAA